MQDKTFFPTVVEEDEVSGKLGFAAGWELKNILSRDLVSSILGLNILASSADVENQLLPRLFQNRTSFAFGLSRLPENTVLEFDLVSLPNLNNPFRGNIFFRFFLRSRADNREAGLSELYRSFIQVQALLNSCFPEAEFTMIRDRRQLASLLRPFNPTRATLITRPTQEITLGKPKPYKNTRFIDQGKPDAQPLPTLHYTSSWVPSPDQDNKLVQFLLWQIQPVWIRVRLGATPDAEAIRKDLSLLMETCDQYETGVIPSQTLYKNQMNLLKERAFRNYLFLGAGGLRTAVLIFTLDTPGPALINLVGESITRIPGKGNFEGMLQGGFQHQNMEPGKALDALWFPEKETLSFNEAAAIIRLPYPPAEDVCGLPIKGFRSSFSQLPETFQEGPDMTFLGVNVHRGMEQPVNCRLQDRLRHMFILGSSGTGKSKFMANLILQDIRAGHGLCLIDPHGETIEEVLGKIPREREQDVILFNPLDTDYPIGLNLLEAKNPEERDRIIDDLYQALDNIYDMRQTGGPIFEAGFRNMMKMLIGDKPRDGFKATILEFSPIYIHRHFRKWLAASTEDEDVKDFLREMHRTGGEASLENLSPYITSKVRRFTTDVGLKRIFGQENTAFDFAEIMNNRKILLLNLGKGRFGSVVSKLLASIIVNRFKTAAMQRGSIPESERIPFFLYVDEFQNLPGEEFAELLAEARKYKLGLILANQFTSQVDKLNHTAMNVFKSILGNVAVFVIFRLGIEDAKALSPLFSPTFSEMDLKTIPNWQAYVSLNLEGRVLPPFNIETRIDQTPKDEETRQRIIENVRRRYARPVEEVDRQIRERRKFFYPPEEKANDE